MMMTPEEREQFANQAEEAVAHPLVQDVIDEYRHNMRTYGITLESGTFPYYGLLKVLTAATQVARAQALGIDPRDLMMSAEDATAMQSRLAHAALEANKPVFVVEHNAQEDT